VVVGEVAGLAATLLPGLEDLARPETVLPAGKRA
jgi:uroporphyrin-III C-methyltransferase